MKANNTIRHSCTTPPSTTLRQIYFHLCAHICALRTNCMRQCICCIANKIWTSKQEYLTEFLWSGIHARQLKASTTNHSLSTSEATAIGDGYRGLTIAYESHDTEEGQLETHEASQGIIQQRPSRHYGNISIAPLFGLSSLHDSTVPQPMRVFVRSAHCVTLSKQRFLY